MRKLIVLLVLVLICNYAFTQTKTRVNAIRTDSGYVAPTKQQKAVVPVTTGKTFTDTKGKVYPVFKGAKGGLYINKVSAKGKPYKMYLKTK